PDDDQHELPAEDLDAEEVDGIAEALGPADQVTAEDVPERLAEDEAELQQREDKWNAQRFEIIDEDRIGAGSVRRGTRADEKAGGDELPEVLREAAQRHDRAERGNAGRQDVLAWKNVDEARQRGADDHVGHYADAAGPEPRDEGR